MLMRAQFEADDGTVGDAHDVVEPGEMFLGFSYALEPSKSTSVCPFAHRRADGQGVHRKRAGDVDRLISVLEAARAMRDRSRSPADLSGEFSQVTKKLSYRLSNAVVHLTWISHTREKISPLVGISRV